MVIRGPCRIDKRTKDLVKRVLPNEIPIVDHIDLDNIAAEALIKKRIKALVNVSPSLSGKYPADGPSMLLAAGIPILDTVDGKVMDLVPEGAIVELENNRLLWETEVFIGRKLVPGELTKELETANSNIDRQLESFALNTFNYGLKEMKSVFAPFAMPSLRAVWRGRQVLMVVRGQDYKEDLSAIRAYIDEVGPFLIGVDGGADALMENGYLPDLVFGDMDSISDRALQCGAEIVVHGYLSGFAPGEGRVRALGLPYQIFPAPGTSEDAALLLAFHGKAELIVALGTHSNLVDFMNKGRQGMASTFLVRLKVGPILVDAKGVNKLYRSSVKTSHLIKLIVAALVPLTVITVINPNTYQIIRLLWLRLRILTGL